MYSKPALMDLVRQLALQLGDFTLASGKKSNYYLDCRKVTLDSAGANLIADGMLEAARRRTCPTPSAAWRSGPIRSPRRSSPSPAARQKRSSGFIVRKEAKQHGTGRDVEGPVQPGESVVIVEDVVTTGGSSLAAIEKAEAFGLKVRGVLAIIDRLEGGRETLAAHGYDLQTLLTIRDFGLEP